MAEGITNSSDTLNILQKIYSVGSLYFNTTDIDPATIFGFGTWERVSKNMTLWGASADGQAGTTKSAGLPDITGTFIGFDVLGDSHGGWTGAFKIQNATKVYTNAQVGPDPSIGVNFLEEVVTTYKASDSSSIYNNSTTVQPPALVVNVWKRTA